MPNDRFCADCSKLIQRSGYCCKYKLRLAREKKNGEPVKYIECVMDGSCWHAE